MIDNQCLRPACVMDVLPLLNRDLYGIFPWRLMQAHDVADALQRLYDAEWKKRGFERSP